MKMLCKSCAQKANHKKIKVGRLRPDPKHPGDRHYDERTLTYRCDECGEERSVVECPNLLADLLSVPKGGRS